MDHSQPLTAGLADRRQLLKASLLGGLAAAVPIAAEAQDRANAPVPPPRLVAAPAMPVVDARFPAEIAPGVFILPDKRISLVPNVGIVVGRDTVLVVDSGLGIESGENVLQVARRLAPGRRIVLTVTHAHPEHGFSAQVFKPDARIYYNRTQADYFARAGATLLDGFRAGVLPPTQRHVLDGVVLTPPDETFEGRSATLDLGGRQVEFRTWGTAHTPGDQIVILPQERIVFTGDLIEERMFPIVPLFPPMISAQDIDVARWEMVLAEITRLEPRLVVPGHGNIGGSEIVTDVLDYFRQVRALVRSAEASSGTLEDRIRARYPTWEHSEYIAPAVQYILQERT